MNYTDRGLDIANMTTGVDVTGLAKYKDSLHVQILTGVVELINNIGDVTSALNQAWQGESRDAFDRLFEEKRNVIIEDLQAEYKDIENRLDELANDYVRQDKALLASVEK